ncbi:TonB-dependent receptor [Oleiharenicola lentus]|uniref:TonB-dependent receptor n=1 Tax=Oleiharenicola lentus TaxID=2508720 RepID=A0A4Q1C4Y3_9BACT|nr:TonB-dependent receptor [Oleiharenicola lentus]RXK53488.1 TonB-dependent receptor [Oleiharenicola lentus]
MKHLTTRCLPLAVLLMIQLPAQSVQPAAPEKDPSSNDSTSPDDTVVLSPFVVNSSKDQGYRASNSVSGSRFDTPIKDLPFALNAFTNEFIQDQHASGLYDIVKYSPGVTFIGGGFDEGNSHFTIRGFDAGTQPLRNGFTGPQVLDPTLVERVEVMKGPSSFLYGQLSPGGIVNVISKRPLSYKLNTLTLSGGSYDYFVANLDSTGPIAKGLSYRLGLTTGQDSHYYDAYDANRWAAAGALAWQVNKTGQIMVSYERFDKDEGPLLNPLPTVYDSRLPDGSKNGLFYPGLPRTFNTSANANYRQTKNRNLVAEYNQGIGEHWNTRLVYASSKRDIEYYTSARFIVGYGVFTTAPIAATATLPAIQPENALMRRPNTGHYWGDTQTYNAEAIGKYQFGGVSAKFLFGVQEDSQNSDNEKHRASTVDYPRAWDLSNPSTWNRDEPVPIMPTISYWHDDVSIKSYWGGLTLGFLDDHLVALTGLRHTETETVSTNMRTGEVLPAYVSSANTPQVGVLYKITPEVSAYAAYSKSFVPNSADLYDADENYLGPAKDPIGEGYDIGLKAAFLDGKLSGTISAYQIRNNNLIQSIAAFNSAGELAFRTVQTGMTQSRGIEFDVVLSPIPNWQTYLAYSHQNAIYYRNPENTALEGVPLLGSVGNMGSVWTKYFFPSGPLKSAYIAGGMTWQGFQKASDQNNALYFRPYALFDMTVGYSTKIIGRNTEFALSVKNIANKEYTPSVNTRGDPRMVILTITTRL